MLSGPKKTKDRREPRKAIDAWESKALELEKKHREEPTAGLKASSLLGDADGSGAVDGGAWDEHQDV